MWSTLQHLMKPNSAPRLAGQRYDSSRPLAFMHIPKTSGLALSRGLEVALRPTRVVQAILDRVLFGKFQAFETMPEHQRSLIFLQAANLPESADYITGHVSFSSLRQRYSTAQYVTFFREPITRIVSFWLFWRSWTDEQLGNWGEFGKLVALARNPLEHFLAQKELAVQFDNLYVRMLLWPHPLLPEDDLIDPRHDAKLRRDATKLLSGFSYTDVVENPELARNLETWLGRPFEYAHVNETLPLGEKVATALHRELTPAAFSALENCTRLDRHLWELIARERSSNQQATVWRRQILLRNMARYALLAAGRAA